jgi:NAD(P)-dependent dehydrogenase (short-subunit alcohol dehydrogenase family)
VVANAAIAGSRDRRIWELSSEEWDELMAVNLRGVWQTVSAVVPTMIAGGRGGSIVIIGSTCAFKGYPMTGHYTTAKHGLIGMMRVFANELGADAIRINMISPTFVDTDLLHFDSVYKAFVPELASPTRDDFEARIRQLHLLPVPWVTSEDVSNAVLWFASDESRYVTAQHLALDAGATEKA